MESDGGGNPRAEIALALAMAFFCIMVVTMVSMGAGEAQDSAPRPISADGLELRPAAVPSAKARQVDAGAAEPVYLIHYRGTYYDRQLKPADPAASIRLEQRSLGDVPFGGAEPAVVATVKGRRVPAWDIERDAAMPPPQSPVHSEEPLVDLTLIPYAAAKLRMTAFPVLER